MADGTTIEDLQNLNSLAVLKFHVGGLAIADYDAPVPDEKTLINADGTFNPEELSGHYFSAGLITTDGITAARAMSADDTKSWQTLSIVRSDVTADDLSFKAKFQETNRVTRALNDGHTLREMNSLFTEDGYNFRRDTGGKQPQRRCVLFAKDSKYGISMAVVLPNLTLSDLGDTAIGRATEMQYDATLKAMYDPTLGSDAAYAFAGPGWKALAGEPLTFASGTTSPAGTTATSPVAPAATTTPDTTV